VIGKQLGSYQIIDKLGAGGMASVYLGYQAAVDRQVAIKVLPPHPGLDSAFVERFEQEARTIAKLQHPHILPLFDYGKQDDIIYLVMAYVDGGTLEDRIAQGGIQLRTIEKILREIASALDYAHRQGIIHRDIKPANILLDGEGHALLADFGIAKLAESSANLTGTGVVGTPAYMSPEQAQGLSIDPRSDIYSLGVVVYQMLTGEQPFDAPSAMQLILKIIQDPPPNILQKVASLPEELGEVMQTVLAKDPDERYQTASAFAEAFSQAIHQDRDSLAAIRAALPLEDQPTEVREKPTILLGQNTSDHTTGQTVIVQQGVSPLVLLGGFAIIAVALVLVVLLIVTRDDDEPNVVDTPVVSLPTETPPQPTDLPQPTTPTFGQVRFGMSAIPGDTVMLEVSALDEPSAGHVYIAWLVNTAQDTYIKLGELRLDLLGSAELTYTDPEGEILPILYNAVYISEETDATTDTLNGDVVYRAAVPIEVSQVLRQILVESPDGLNGGSLLDGAKSEVEAAVRHAGLASNAATAASMHSHAEHTINILRGERIDYDGDGSGVNPGRGVGLYTFLEQMETLLVEAVTQEDATPDLQRNAEFLRVCLQNTRLRANRIIALEQELLASDSVEAVQEQAAESTLLAAQLNDGDDLNENGRIELFEGECGLAQISDSAIYITNMDVIKVE